jgi:transcription termination factor Rho
MEGTLLTVEETVELAPVSTPTPRRRAPRPRAAAKPAAESTGDGVAEQEAVATLENTQDRSPAQEEVAPESSSEAVALSEPETAVSVDAIQVPDVQIADAAGTEAPEIAATEWAPAPVSPPSERPVGSTGDGRADLNQRNRTRDSRGRRDRGPRPAPSDRSNGAERYSGDGRDSRQSGDGRQAGYNQSRPRNGAPYAAPPAPTRTGPPHLTIAELEAKTAEELAEMARDLEIPSFGRLPKQEQMVRLLRAQTEKDGQIFGDGILEIIEDGFGFLRGPRFLPGPDDIYVSQSQIRRFGLRTGDRISGQVRPPKDNEKFFSLLRVEAVNGIDAETARRRPSFDSLTPIFPLELINLETAPNILSTRLLNLVAPIGRGQRGLIVSPPKAGKTMLLKAIANGISSNCPDIHLMVCLIGERPEEVTDMRRSIEGEVISSTFDEPVEDHTKVAEMALERAKRLVEGGRDVVILLDSITRLARAYNLAVPPSGRTLSGGIDPVALYPPKRFFGAARNIEGGGSLTVVSTCLIDTGSRMDDVIYEEFKGTGNMELHLDRKLAERRIYPSIDIQRSGTRREELLLDESTLRQVWTMRRMVSMLGGSEGTELLLSRLSKTQANDEFLETLNRDV